MKVISSQLFNKLTFSSVSQMSEKSTCLRLGFLGGESHIGNLWRRPARAPPGGSEVRLDKGVVDLQCSHNKDPIRYH